MKGTAVFTLALVVFVNSTINIRSQDESVPSPESVAPAVSGSELDQLLEPIALYPDPLIAQILPAATQPQEIQQAAAFISQGGDPNLIDQQPWDSSVKAVARYPDVLNLMNGNLPWTTQLGQAFVDQPDDVMNSIQSLRAQAQDLGNLESTPDDQVTSDDGTIEIVPVDPDLIYVPVYDPGLVFFQRPYGRQFISWGHGYRTGVWLNHDFNWHDHNVIVWDHSHPRPANWWHEKPSQRPAQVMSRAPVWRPQGRSAVVPVQKGDRGYTRPAPRPVQTRPVENHGPVEVHQIPARPTVHEAAAPRPVERPVSAPAPRSSGGAFGGGQSARDMRAASSRGQTSRQGVSHSAPAPRSAPSGGGGGGGGGHKR